MISPTNSRDIALQATVPRVLNTTSSYISLVASAQEVNFGADNQPLPTQISVTALLAGVLKGTVAFQATGLQVGTVLTTDPTNANKLLLNPLTFLSETVTITAVLTFGGVTYTSLPVSIYKKYTGIVTRISRSFDSLTANGSGTGYTLPAANNYIELYNGNTKFVSGVTFTPALQTKNGLSAALNATTGLITISEASPNTWTSDYEDFTFYATYNYITYPVKYTITKVKQNETTKDLTPPPTPTNFQLQASNTHLIIIHDDPTYTTGHGHESTYVYGIKWNTGDPIPVFTSPGVSLLATFSGFVGKIPTAINETWYIWIKWKSIDGVLSITPAGGTNGLNSTTTKLNGEWQIAPLSVVEANIGLASISSAKIAGVIESSNYIQGASGWAISRTTGNAEFNNLTARGNITANNLSAATGTFSGTLMAAGGRFSGTIQAGAIDISSVAGESVTYSTAGTFYVPVPLNITKMRVTLIGGGGGGQSGWGAYSGFGGAGAGGGAGQMVSQTFDVNETETYTVVLGAGGGAGTGYYGAPNGITANGPSGSPGGASYLKTAANVTLLTANGGVGGAKWLSYGTGNATGYNPALGSETTHYGFTGSDTEFAPGGAYNTAGNKGSGGGGGNADNLTDTQTIGGVGGAGFILIEFYNPNALIGRSEWNTFLSYVGLTEVAPTDTDPAIFSGVLSVAPQPHYSYAYWPGTQYSSVGTQKKFIKEAFTITEMAAWTSTPVAANTKISLKANGQYIANVTIPAGFSYGTQLSETTVTLSEAGDPYYSYVRLLMQFNGADQGIVFTDTQNHSFTRVGSVVTSAARYKFGTASLYFPSAANSYIYTADSSDFEFTNGDFCIDGWIYMTEYPPIPSTTGHYGVICKRGAINSQNSWALAVNSYSNRLTFSYSVTGTETVDPFTGSDTKILLHYDGSNGGTTFTESGLNRTMTATGTPTTSTTITPVFGTASLLLNGTSQIATAVSLTEIAVGTGDFTAETWFRSSSATSADGYILRIVGTSTFSIRIGSATYSDKLLISMVDGTTSAMYTINKTRSTDLLNIWHHIAVVRQSGVLKVYLNGIQENMTQVSSGTTQASWSDTTNITSLTNFIVGGSTSGFIGNIDETRISKIAVYTSNFTVPTNAFYLSAAAGSFARAVQASSDIPINVWVHFAVVRNGTNLTIYQNGVAGTSVNIGTTSIFDGSASVNIGALDSGSWNSYFRGYLDDIRITKGIPRYTAAFNVPTSQSPSHIEDYYTNVDTPISNLSKAVPANSYITLDLTSTSATDIGFRFKYIY